MSKSKTKTSPLRAALAAKTTLRTYFDLPIVGSDVVEDRQRAVAVAQQLVAATLVHDDAAVRDRADEALTKARGDLAECFHRIYFRGLTLADFDALVALHPPTEQQAGDGWIWNPDTFNFALIAECAIDSDLTAAEWQAELESDRWSRADRARLVDVCLAANQQTMSDAVPKD